MISIIASIVLFTALYYIVVLLFQYSHLTHSTWRLLEPVANSVQPVIVVLVLIAGLLQEGYISSVSNLLACASRADHELPADRNNLTAAVLVQASPASISASRQHAQGA